MTVSHRQRSRRGVSAEMSRAALFFVLVLSPSVLLAQETILELDFEDPEDLSIFFAPEGLAAVDLCGDEIPNGTTEIVDGELVMTNDEVLGLDMLSFDPDEVGDLFPDDTRDYRLRVLVNLESVNELLVYLRGRVGVDKENVQFDSEHERGYAFAIICGSVAEDPAFFDGAIAIAELTRCHDAVPHNDWLNSQDGFALAAPGFAITPGDWYWIEISAQGPDEGGPVLLSMSIWPEDDDPPAAPQLTVVDDNGLNHTDATLDPENNIEVLIGTSFDFGQQPLATARLDELSITTIGGCAVAPATVTRSLWGEPPLIEGNPTATFVEGDAYTVTLDVSEIREEGVCSAAGSITLLETAPPGWEIDSVSAGGEIVEDNIARWEIDLGEGPVELTYDVSAVGEAPAQFLGEFSEPESGFQFVVGGANAAVPEAAISPISDFGTIQQWLILGPFEREVEGANPGAKEIARDYLTDGDVVEEEVCPRAGDTIEPDYSGGIGGGEAASTGLAPNTFGRNPDDVPTWVEWIDLDDEDDRIDIESVYGTHDEVMIYAVTYLVVEEDMVVNFGFSSDDSVYALLDGELLHSNPVARGALGRAYQDTPLSHKGLGEVELTEGVHTLLVKIFEGGGEHNFRVGFVDEFGLEIAGGPEGLTVTLNPDSCPGGGPTFLRGDADARGSIELTDGITTLNFLFLGGAAPACADAADTDDNGAIELTDAVATFSYLFLGGDAPADPGPVMCGEDPTDDDPFSCDVEAACP